MDKQELASKIMDRAMMAVKEKTEVLTLAVNLLTPRSVEGDLLGLATDGEYLFYSPGYTLRIYESGNVEILERAILHIVIHGLLGHFEDTSYKRYKLAWRVMDIAVEQVLSRAGLSLYNGVFVENLPRTIGMSLYYHSLTDKRISRRVMNSPVQANDDHSFWWQKNKRRCKEPQKTCGGKSGSSKDDGSSKKADRWKKAREYLMGDASPGDTKNPEEKLSAALRSGNKAAGTDSDDEVICAVAKGEEFSFTDVFGQFLTTKTSCREDTDQNDRMLYQYGLYMYGDVPLIEPCEEKEDAELENLVIALDTSGSCEGYIDIFLAQLMGIFRDLSTNIKFKKIYLIQCDSRIKNICEFEEVEELREVSGSMKMYGFGGTDFRPVFSWIKRNLTEKDEQVDCLLYFSDAEGSFPKRESEYPVFFILPESEDCGEVEVPGWIKKVYLTKNKGE